MSYTFSAAERADVLRRAASLLEERIPTGKNYVGLEHDVEPAGSILLGASFVWPGVVVVRRLPCNCEVVRSRPGQPTRPARKGAA